MNWIFDTHIHLSDPEYRTNFEIITNSMEKVGIKACAVSIDNESSQITLNLAKKSNLILPFVGIHPEKASENLDSMLALIETNSNTISGIGEIGLDKTYAQTNEQLVRQNYVFKKLLAEAEKLKKPVSVHSRTSLEDILEIIPSYHISGFLLHWFDGSKKQLKKAMDLGCFVSYGPVTVYSQDKQVLVSNTQQDRILVETDGPVKFSHCFGMKPSQIIFIPSVIFCLSKILGRSYDDVLMMLESNSKNYLGI